MKKIRCKMLAVILPAIFILAVSLTSLACSGDNKDAGSSAALQLNTAVKTQSAENGLLSRDEAADVLRQNLINRVTHFTITVDYFAPSQEYWDADVTYFRDRAVAGDNALFESFSYIGMSCDGSYMDDTIAWTQYTFDITYNEAAQPVEAVEEPAPAADNSGLLSRDEAAETLKQNLINRISHFTIKVNYFAPSQEYWDADVVYFRDYAAAGNEALLESFSYIGMSCDGSYTDETTAWTQYTFDITYNDTSYDYYTFDDHSGLLSRDEAAEVLKQQVINRVNSFTIRVNYFAPSQEYWDADIEYFKQHVIEHTGVPNEGDYLYLSFNDIIMNCEGSYMDDTTAWTQYSFNITYNSTAEQEAEVTAAAEALIAEIIHDGMTDKEKATAIYEWMCSNITYDNSLDPISFSTYGALINRTAVCQGFSSLMYRLMLMAGVDCRCITGYGDSGYDSGDHIWNIICVDGLYYNCDAAWDAGQSHFTYFMRKDRNGFNSGHVRDYEYTTEEFYARYPMAQ